MTTRCRAADGSASYYGLDGEEEGHFSEVALIIEGASKFFVGTPCFLSHRLRCRRPFRSLFRVCSSLALKYASSLIIMLSSSSRYADLSIPTSRSSTPPLSPWSSASHFPHRILRILRALRDHLRHRFRVYSQRAHRSIMLTAFRGGPRIKVSGMHRRYCRNLRRRRRR